MNTSSRHFHFYIVLGALIALWSCSSKSLSNPLDDLDDEAVKVVLQRAIQHAGGWHNWQSLEKISYKKKSILYHADGSIESEVNQQHRYVLRPALKGSISWRDSSGIHEILFGQGQSAHLLNGNNLVGKEEAARESFLSNYYVLFMPFKLLDPGVRLTYLGIDTLDNGRIVDGILAEYDPQNQENHSTPDVWTYYFDAKTGEYLASMVYHAPTYAFIENTEMNDDFQIRLQSYRESFRVDSLRNKQYLRGVFFYSDYSLN